MGWGGGSEYEVNSIHSAVGREVVSEYEVNTLRTAGGGAPSHVHKTHNIEYRIQNTEYEQKLFT